MRKSKKSSILLTIILIGIVPILLYILFQYYSHRQITEVKVEGIKKEVRQAQQYVDTVFKNVEYDLKLISLNPHIRAVKLSNFSKSDSLYRISQLNDHPIYKAFERYTVSHPDYSSIFLGTEDGEFMVWPSKDMNGDYDPRKRIWYKLAIREPGKTIRTSLYSSESLAGNEFIVTTARTFYDETGSVKGVVGINSSTKQLSKIIQNIVIGENGYIFLFNADGMVITNPKQNESIRFLSQLKMHSLNKDREERLPFLTLMDKPNGQLEVIFDGEPSLILWKTSEITGLKLAAVISKSELIYSKNWLTNILAFSLIGSVITLLLFFYISQKWRLLWEESDQKYRSLFKYHPSATFSSTCDGTIMSVNQSFETLLGYSTAEIIHQSIFTLIDFDNAKIVSHYLEQALQGNAQFYHLKIQNKNAEYLDIEMTNVPIIISSEVVGVYWIARDITEQLKAEEYILKSEKLSIAGQLAAGIAHEIRNPLTSLKGFLQLMFASGNQKQEYFNIMRDELDRIEYILSELLMLSKPQSTHFQAKNVSLLLEQIVTLLESQALLNNVSVELSKIDEPLYLYCDEHQIKQVFINIIKNGIESMPRGGILKIETLYTDKEIFLRFIDQGKGIPPELIHKIGEPFYTTKEKGTGLGLMVTFKIIEHHGGTVNIQSELNKGTMFEIQFPLHVKEEKKLAL